MSSNSLNSNDSVEGIAIIGMAGRFPGAENIAEFWENLKNGVESITTFTNEELVSAGIDIGHHPDYVRARGILQDVDKFDADFFNMTPKEAELTDPQHRLLLETAWEAMEDAGYGAEHSGSVGVYAGMSKNTYFLSNLYPNRDRMPIVDAFPTEMGNEKDYLATRISYKLNLTGPSINLSTACSTSLVTTYHACEALLNYQCDMALTGGVCVKVPQAKGYWYEEGSIGSPDGHCRSYDAEGKGTVFSNGVAMVLLKRLDDALKDGDQIYAVIKGIAINNDGSTKVGFGAPSVDGQAEAVIIAQALAKVEPETVSYIEGHGTATPLGDPIEVSALTQAFLAGTDAKGFCALGSVKSNIGHLDAAAGITGLIKTALALKYKLLPPSLHFEKPNPKFDIENTPFYVNTKLTDWESGKTPRRAGVSSFGTGGTNAHAVLEEAPIPEPSNPSRSWQLLQLSAKTATALEIVTANFLQYLKLNPDCNLADVAYTLQVGRKSFPHRRILVCQELRDAMNTIESLAPRIVTQFQERKHRTVVFMFPGQGSQYVNMGLELYQSEPVFREQVDLCTEILKPLLGRDLRHVLYPGDGRVQATRQLKETSIAQPAIFVIEYALAKMWMTWGIQPEKMIGHSIGEFVAACLAGVFSLKDALALLAVRGRLIQDLPGGSMLAVPLPEQEVLLLLEPNLSLAAINSPSNCVVSGPNEAIEELEQKLMQREIASRHLHTSHAFHSAMMDPILETFTAEVCKVRLNPPQIPFLSSSTGNWISSEQATDPSYWARHLRQTVRFADGRQELAKIPDQVLLEVGPGNTLTTLAQHPAYKVPAQVVLSSLGHVLDDHQDVACCQKALGKLWLEGVVIDWSGYYAHERRCRIALPTYPFERKRYWIDPPKTENHSNSLPSTIPIPLEAQVASHTAVETEPAFKQENPVPTKLNLVCTPSRKERILTDLQSVMYDLGGLESDQINVKATFLELGFDSLFLTQASIAFKKKFGVKVTFRQLLEQTPTPETLAEYIDIQLPPEALPAVAPLPAVTPPTIGVPVTTQLSVRPVLSDMGEVAAPSGSTLERVISQQLQVMTQQLEILRNNGGMTQGIPTPQELVSIQDNVQPQLGSNGIKLIQTLVAKATDPTPAQEKGTDKLQRFGSWKPFDKSATQSLSPRQQKYLDDLIARYTTRTPTSKQITQTHRPHLADPRSASGFRAAWKEMVYPIVAVRSSGANLWDVDGNKYIDVHSGFGSVLFGHSPEFIKQAVEEQLKQGVQIGPQSTLAGEVATLICELTNTERVTFCNSGSEAVLAAMRVARTVTGRNKIATFTNDYHGMFDEVLVRSVTIGGKSCSIPVAPGIPSQKVENILVLEYGNPQSLEILKEHASDLAAILVEPVQSRHPDLQPREFLHALREWTEKEEIVLIFDEVITGFRLHAGGAQAWFDIQADLVTYGKIIGGGMPMGVLAGKAAFMDALDGGMWNYGDDSFPEVGVTYFAGTFVRHPLALAAALPVLKHLKQSGPQLHEQLNKKAAQFAANMNGYFERVRASIHLEQSASLLIFKFLETLEFSSLLFFYLREKGVYILEGGSFFLTVAHTDEDLAFVAQAIKQSVAEMQEAGFLPGGIPDATSVDPKKQDGVAFPSQYPTPQRFPLTEAQTEIWLASQMGKEASCAFNETLALQLTGPLNLECLRQAVQVVTARHQAFHLRFSLDGAYQETTPPVFIDIPLQDFSTLEQATKDAKVAEILKQEASEPFDLFNGPLLRVQIINLVQQEYLLVFSAHHIVFDGWSSGLLLHELSIVYSETCQGKLYQLPEPTRFSEYVIVQAADQENSKAEAYQYWVDQFADTPAVLELPTDRPRPPFKSYRGGTVKRTFDPAVYPAIKQVALEQRATLFAILLAAYQVLLTRLSRQEDIVVGVSAAGQAMTGEAALVGHCVNLLPVRSRCDFDSSFRDFLAAIKTRILDAYEHHQCTFGGILQHLQLPRDPSRLPLIDAIFNLDPKLIGHGFHGLEASLSQSTKTAVNFDLFLNINEVDDGLTAAWHYNTDLYDESTIQRWIGHYETLLKAIAADPNQTLGTLNLLSEPERNQITISWNDTQADYPQDICIHQLFEAQVERTPDAVAVVFEDEQLTYRELNSRANQLAHYLRSLGVGPEVLVGIYLERSVEMVIGLLGILKAGGAYVPLDAAYPQERLAFILADVQISVLLTEEKLVASLPKHTQVVILDTDQEGIAQQRQENPTSQSTASNLAYVIYTSGSTGRPKGVGIEHHNTVTLLHWAREVFPPEALTGVLASTSICFDLSVFELFVPLSWGGKAILAENALHLTTLTTAKDVTLINTVPSAIAELLRVKGVPPSVHTVNLAGEPLRAPLVAQLYQQETIRCVFDLYGPSEDTTYSTFALRSEKGPETIGRPIVNTQLYLLDAQMQPVPIGVHGELHIGGAGLARGYLNRPELTAEKFIPNPFSQEPGARLYKTGDLARYLPDGNIEFLGRIDSQVKIRGFRIELGEVETALGQLSGVREAVVLAREDRPGDKRLVGYVVPNQGQVLTTDQLHRFLKEKLPAYMVPYAFVMLEALPLTPNGKVDRRVLPAPDQSRPELERAFVAPRSPVEEVLAEIWAVVLGLERVGIHDNFFLLGGHSLLGTRLISRVRDTFQVELPLRRLFEFPTVAGVTESIETAQRCTGLQIPPIIPVSHDGLPLSFAQQRLWFLDQLVPNNPLYNISEALRIGGLLNVDALEQSFKKIVQRHESLRTTFVMVEGQQRQVVAPALSMTLPVLDLQEIPEHERSAEALRLATNEAQQPFDLAQGPLLRATLLLLGEQDHMLLLTMHHIISDGWSMGVFIQELTVLYEAFSTGKPSPLPELPIQYADFTHWQRQWLQGEVLENQLSYWQQQLAGAPGVLPLPTDRPRPHVQTFQGAIQSFMLPSSLSEALKALSQGEGVTLFMTLLAAFQTLLYRYTSQSDIVVGSPIANRNWAKIESLIGLFVNTVVLRTDLSGNITFRELLGRVREVTLGAYTHQDLPFEKLVEKLQPERDLSYTPLFQVMFVLQNAPMATLDIPSLTLSRLEFDSKTAKFDLTLSMEDTVHGLSGSLEYNTDLFDAATISRMVGHFQTMLTGIVAEPEQCVSTLPLLTEAERHQVLVEWNNTKKDYPQEQCLQQLVEAQVERTPDAIAVVFEAQQLTYRELNQRANQLAHYLRSLGVGPEVLVGIYLERSLEMAVGFLGILKAGGAYLPLDPAYSSERLAFMLEDSLAPVLLSQQHLVGVLPDCTAQVVLLDADWEAITQDQSNLICETTSQNLAYIIYTSGSTGKPKGVMISHQALVNHNVAITTLCNLSQSDRVLQFSSISFDIAVEELFPTWISGATLVLRSQEMLSSPTNFLRFVEQERLTVLNLPTAFWHEVLWGMSALKHPLPVSLRLVIVGGEKASRSAYLTWLDLVGKHPCWLNTYGPTETTVTATAYDPAASLEVRAVSEIPIGRPLVNVQVYILDRQLQPVPIGVPGELYIGGAGLARGYLNHPELTKEKFISNPFSDEPGTRLYKTGDLARYLPDGNIEFLGRIDNQVKIRGFRIELGEVETALCQLPGVREAVVLAREDRPGDKRLVGYVVPNQEVLTTDQLRHFLKEKLPAYMVPYAFVMLEALPLTPNGKVDRRVLPAPDEVRQPEETFVASRDELELQLTEIWEKVLGIEPIGVRDNFFELGGHSLLAVRLFAQIEQTFGKNFPLSSLFQAPTIEQLASILRCQEESSAPWSSLVTIQGNGFKPPLFCIHGGGSNVLIYHDLARYMGLEQPVYGLQAKGLDGKEEPHRRIEDMAAEYIKQMRSVQPEGAYFLAGLSAGGNIALEIAQQLHAQGQQVAVLAMFDSYGSDSFELLPPIPRLLSVLRYATRYSLPRFMGKLRQLEPKSALTEVLEKMRFFQSISNEQSSKVTVGQLEFERPTDGIWSPSNSSYLELWIDNFSMFILESSPWAFLAPKTELQSIGGSLPHALQKIEEAHSKAQKAYVPKVYPGRITVFRASERPPGYYTDPQLGWGEIAAGGVEIYDVPGHHSSIVTSPVLVEKLRACIDKALAT